MKKKFECLTDQKFTSLENEQMNVLYGGKASDLQYAVTYGDIDTSTVRPSGAIEDGPDVVD
ncbi:MAG: hypothetical protein LBJ63_05165 [Prevotellaceae bacterium]|jgi:hypothetical protein|nr:hypothetical protein [Prevotellaceae bacterium]